MTRGKRWKKKIVERKREKNREKGEKERKERKKRNRAHREKKDVPKIYWQKCSKSDKVGGPVVAHYHY